MSNDYADIEPSLKDTDAEVNLTIDIDVTEAIFKAFSINEEMGGSQKTLLDIVSYGRDLYCKNCPAANNRWPHSYSACLQVLRKAGYTDPVTYHICLDSIHPNQWSAMEDPKSLCQYCHNLVILNITISVLLTR